jgi:leucyl aminopeptidase
MLAAAVVDGAELASYRFTDYSSQARKEEKSRALRQVILLVNDERVRDIRRQVRSERKILEGTKLTRDLVNQPAAEVRPSVIKDRAKEIASQFDDVTVTVFNEAQAKRRGFTAFLAVARGSKEDPYVIHLKYRPKGLSASAKKVFIVGKGITFDSGGLSLKPSKGMEIMKDDMAGAATVLGLFSILSELGVEVEVHGVIAACENMPGGEAYRPGDILQAKNGKTIEVLNTDAEGRITLADTLSYAEEHKPDVIIDVATLTGACVVALGDTYAGLWSNDEKISKCLLKAAKKAGEGLVELPMPQEYRQMISSNVADVRNTPLSDGGGAITAALFLKEFVGDVPWAHIDIAGAGYMEREWLPYYGVGATGYGVRTLVEFIKELY